MRVQITTTAIERPSKVGSSIAQTMFLEGQELEFYANSAGNLVVFNPMSKTSYITDFAYSGVAAVLAAAPATGGHFILT